MIQCLHGMRVGNERFLVLVTYRRAACRNARKLARQRLKIEQDKAFGDIVRYTSVVEVTLPLAPVDRSADVARLSTRLPTTPCLLLTAYYLLLGAYYLLLALCATPGW